MAGLAGLVTGNWTGAGSPGTQSSYQAGNLPLAGSSYGSTIGAAGQNALANNDMAGGTGQQQSALADFLRSQIAGNGPSLAQQQLQNATQQNIGNAASLIGSQRGLNPALAQRQIANQAAAANQQAAGQSATTRLQEQLGAESMLGGALGTQRGQDIGQQQANTALYGAGAGAQNAQNQVGAELQGINANTANQNAQRTAGLDAANAGINSGFAAGALQGAGGALGLPGLKFARGGVVPGDSQFPPDDGRNDKVPILAAPGEVVVPESKATPEAAADFVRAATKEAPATRSRKPPKLGYGQVLQRQRQLESRIAEIEAMLGRR